MLAVGDKLPQFRLKTTVSTDLNKVFTDIDNDTYKGK
jgi:peroxiredoxin (alkyl hydroperoxide reductase subunit C)